MIEIRIVFSFFIYFILNFKNSGIFFNTSHKLKLNAYSYLATIALSVSILIFKFVLVMMRSVS